MKRLKSLCFISFLSIFFGAHWSIAFDVARSKLVDLTHSFDKNTIYWPTSPTQFTMKALHKGKTESGYFYSAFSICTPEHGGTHIDAPFHFSERNWSVDKIPLTQLVGDAILIDLQSQVKKNKDYRLSLSDIDEWEKRFGKIPDGAIVIIRTGWEKYWPNAKEYLGDEKDVKKLRFPSFGEEAVEYLIKNRKIKAIGIDTASIDYGLSNDFPVHRIVGRYNVPGFENLTNLDQIPPKGSIIIALPMKIAGGSGGPLRIIGIIPN